jgi:hypothetical protein
MKNVQMMAGGFVSFFFCSALGQSTLEQIDTTVLARIRNEGMNHSYVMETLHPVFRTHLKIWYCSNE